MSQDTGRNHRSGRSRRRRQQPRSRRTVPHYTSRTSHKRRGSQRRPSSATKRSSQPRIPVSNETSAGGFVISGMAEACDNAGHVDFSQVYVPLIGREDRQHHILWSMPKGHVEPGESFRATAEREVWEETGIRGEVFEDLGVIDYWFMSNGVRIHKTVHHHLLRYVDGILNDEDPEVTEVAWVPVTKLSERLAYQDERKMARKLKSQLAQLAVADNKAGRVTPR